MAPKWVLQLKPGDQWLDESMRYIGTCDKLVGVNLTFTWYKLDGSWKKKVRHTINVFPELDGAWIPMSSLLKELL